MHDFETFTREAWDLLSRKVENRAKITQIYSIAAASIGLPTALDSPAMDMFRLQLSRYQLLNEHREQGDIRAQQFLANNSDFQRRQILPGIAGYHAADYTPPTSCTR